MAEKADIGDPVKAVKPLAGMVVDADPETMRAGKRQLWQLVRRVGRPANGAQQQEIVKELLSLLAPEQAVAVKREVIWMLSEIAGDECIEPVAALLNDKDLRQDACMVLERLPGEKPLDALQAGLKTAPEDFRICIAHSLRARGVAVAPGDAPPCQKLKPIKQTQVTPVGR